MGVKLRREGPYSSRCVVVVEFLEHLVEEEVRGHLVVHSFQISSRPDIILAYPVAKGSQKGRRYIRGVHSQGDILQCRIQPLHNIHFMHDLEKFPYDLGSRLSHIRRVPLPGLGRSGPCGLYHHRCEHVEGPSVKCDRSIYQEQVNGPQGYLRTLVDIRNYYLRNGYFRQSR